MSQEVGSDADGSQTSATKASSAPGERRARPRGTDHLSDRASASQVPDEVLARQAGLGDKQAFAQLVTRHGPALYRYVSRLVNSTTDAQDCVQEVMLTAWKNIASFRGDSSVRTWLLVLGRHQAQRMLTRYRPPFPASGSRPVVDVDEVAGELRDLHSGPEGATLESELLVAIDTALALLPERQRSVWILREIEDLSYAEIATVVGSTPTAVRGLLNRARTAMAATLEDWR
ncbi:RNA polymerase sigma factor [Kineococcus sp. GCM10028916]|uniref:RNA polymerase sigma factor n=1 Tax=Kineococcus sp. GCM10028916 TaxID=3273394 RepID=UPI003631EE56